MTGGTYGRDDRHDLTAPHVGLIGQIDPAEVMAQSALDETIPPAVHAVQVVGAASSQEPVLARPAVEAILAASSQEPVPAGHAVETIVGTASAQAVFAAAGLDHVGLCGAHDPVGTRGAW